MIRLLMNVSGLSLLTQYLFYQVLSCNFFQWFCICRRFHRVVLWPRWSLEWNRSLSTFMWSCTHCKWSRHSKCTLSRIFQLQWSHCQLPVPAWFRTGWTNRFCCLQLWRLMVDTVSSLSTKVMWVPEAISGCSNDLRTKWWSKYR